VGEEERGRREDGHVRHKLKGWGGQNIWNRKWERRRVVCMGQRMGEG